MVMVGVGVGDIVSLFLYSLEIPKLFVGIFARGIHSTYCPDVSDSYLDTFCGQSVFADLCPWAGALEQ